MALTLYDAVYEVVGAHADIDRVFDAVPDNWAKIEGRWVRLVKHEASDGDLVSDYFTEED